MRTWFLSVVVGVSLLAPAHAQPQPQPKLVLAIVIDQFRYDYLTRFRSEYTGGLKRLLDQGADFTNARYQHVPTVTAELWTFERRLKSRDPNWTLIHVDAAEA